jgi:SAM-dependent methyltransferase
MERRKAGGQVAPRCMAALSPSRTLLRSARSFSHELPILDVVCGFGRNALALAKLGFKVVCADRDLYRLDTLMRLIRTSNLDDALFPLCIEIGAATWPFAPACFSAVIFVHYLNMLLFTSVHQPWVTLGRLCEMVEGETPPAHSPAHACRGPVLVLPADPPRRHSCR